jgi:hypothetical protein
MPQVEDFEAAWLEVRPSQSGSEILADVQDILREVPALSSALEVAERTSSTMRHKQANDLQTWEYSCKVELDQIERLRNLGLFSRVTKDTRSISYFSDVQYKGRFYSITLFLVVRS